MTVGMYCVALKNDSDRYANWAGWRYLAALLTELGCPMAEFGLTNDEDIVSEDTGRQYGEAIKNAINGDYVFEVRIANKHYSDGFVTKPVVFRSGNLTTETRDGQYASYVELKTPGEVAIEVLQGKRPDASQPTPTMNIHSVLPDRTAGGQSLVDLITGQKLRKIDDERKEWLLGWADFFVNSGGFYQL
jgi:hypothetical protein